MSDPKLVHFQWIPGHSFLPGKLADSLAKVGALLTPPRYNLLSLSPLISSQRLSLYSSWRHSIQFGLFQHRIPPVSSEELTLPRLRCNGQSTLLGTYLHRVGRAETPSCSNCSSESQDLFHLVLDCPVLDPMRRAIFGHSLSIQGELTDYLDFTELIRIRAPIPRNGSGKPTATRNNINSSKFIF